MRLLEVRYRGDRMSRPSGLVLPGDVPTPDPTELLRARLLKLLTIPMADAERSIRRDELAAAIEILEGE